MTEDKINENKVLAQNGGSGTNKDEREGNAKVDRKNEAFVQASLSIFSGIVSYIVDCMNIELKVLLPKTQCSIRLSQYGRYLRYFII